MRTGEIILLGVGAAVVYNLVSKASSLSQIKILPGQVTNIGFNGTTPVITFTLLAQNTSNSSLTINSFAGTLTQVATAGNVIIATISDFVPQIVPANSQVQLNFSANLMLIGAVQTLINSFQTGNMPVTLNLTGTLNADNYTIPINTNFNL